MKFESRGVSHRGDRGSRIGQHFKVSMAFGIADIMIAKSVHMVHTCVLLMPWCCRAYRPHEGKSVCEEA